VQLVEIPITVTGDRASERALNPDDIIVREGNTSRPVISLSTAAETPLTVGLVIDTSASMQQALPDVQEAAVRFLETVLTARDRAFLVTFNSSAQLIQPPTRDTALLRSTIMKMRPSGLTALHDAVALGLLQFEGVAGRRALVVLTDGVDRTSRYGADDVANLARRMNVPIHIIAARSRNRPLPYRGLNQSSAEASQLMHAAALASSRLYRQLVGMAQTSGGTSHQLTSLDTLTDVYARIASALSAQILAVIRTDPGTKENEWRALDVDVRDGKIDILAPEGYYAPW
jgi:VWFA-related protein